MEFWTPQRQELQHLIYCTVLTHPFILFKQVCSDRKLPNYHPVSQAAIKSTPVVVKKKIHSACYLINGREEKGKGKGKRFNKTEPYQGLVQNNDLSQIISAIQKNNWLILLNFKESFFFFFCVGNGNEKISYFQWLRFSINIVFNLDFSEYQGCLKEYQQLQQLCKDETVFLSPYFDDWCKEIDKKLNHWRYTIVL